jgi:hypothetical protein
MTSSPSVPVVDIVDLDQWLNESKPDVVVAAEELNRLRDLEDQVRLAEAHVIGYVRQQLRVSDLEDDPGVLEDTRMIDDE